MASDEHVKLLRGGVKGWNRWRGESFGVRPGLRRADLSDASLSHADFSGAYLSGANLTRAYLAEADLEGADLGEASLRGANLIDADLYYPELRGADLSGAVLSGAVLADVDLRQVKGLESVRHHSPSTIGTDTLERSHGQIPRGFLKGCGLSDWQIEAARLFDPELDVDQRTAIMYEMERVRSEQAFHVFRVFISYTREDTPFVEALEQLFDEKGVRYWRDVHDMKAGRLERQIDRAIDLNPLVLLVLSERSVESDWVEWEASRARALEKQYRKAGNPRDVLCPVVLDDAWKSCDWHPGLRQRIEAYNVLDFLQWQDEEEMAQAFARLYDGVILNYRQE